MLIVSDGEVIAIVGIGTPFLEVAGSAFLVLLGDSTRYVLANAMYI